MEIFFGFFLIGFINANYDYQLEPEYEYEEEYLDEIEILPVDEVRRIGETAEFWEPPLEEKTEKSPMDII